MLDLPRLLRMRLTRRPRGQEVVANVLLRPNYTAAGVHIVVEGREKLPPEPVIFAMNHTDRYNYWPFQYWLYREPKRYTATWVKAKYYENPAVARFMELTNNLPTVSRGYLVTKDFTRTVGRRPTDEEYTALRGLVEEKGEIDRSAVPREIFEKPRDMLGRYFEPRRETYEQALRALFKKMMERFVELHEEAFALDLDLLIFPQGTRSIRLSRGHSGLAQIALRFGKTVVPVGCNGSDEVYPGSSPVGRKGTITYRIGDPIRPDELAPPLPPFTPFDRDAEKAHGAAFQHAIDIVMSRIEPLLDEKYRYGEDKESDGVRGSARFL